MLIHLKTWLQKLRLALGFKRLSPCSPSHAGGGQKQKGTHAGKRFGRSQSRSRTPFRPAFEALEARTVPSGFCATPGKDGTPGAPLGGIVNTYYAGTANVAAGATTINLGAPQGAATLIGNGDLLLVIQVQNADINSSNNTTYGDGSGSGAGSLSTTAGTFEYVEAKSSVGGGGALTIAGTGGGGGLLNSYFEAGSTATHGQETFEVVRVPQYVSATLSSTLTAASWNGATGGILAVDVSGNLNLNSATVGVNGEGFRGGAGRRLGGDATASRTDYVNQSTVNAHGSKGEGTAGTPEWVYDRTTDTNINTGQSNDGYPGGSSARGAPGNAGGGGTEADPVNNDENTGGGGGGNGGKGGQGGYSWRTAQNLGGLGGAVVAPAVGNLVLGGGGGAGVRNDSPSLPTASAGGTGGGIVLLRTGSVTGTGTITANGVMGVTPQNDGGPGGGAGGDVEVLVGSGGLTGLAIQARGARGTDAFPLAGPGGTPPPSGGSNFHGPGGGGGGGVVVLSGPAGPIDVNGGGNGTTTTSQDIYGAAPGNPGVILMPPAAESNVPGVHAGFECTADVSVIASAPSAVLPGGTITYTLTVHNGGPADAQTISLTDAVPIGTTFVSATQTGGGSAFTLIKPAVGATGTLTATDATLTVNDTATFLMTVQLNAGVTTGATITDTANVSTATLDPNQANNSSTVLTTVGPDADLVVTNSAPATVAVNGTLIYTLTVSNNGPSDAQNVLLQDLLPAGTTFASQTQTSGPTFTLGNTGNQLNDTLATLASGQSATFQVQATVTAPALTVLSDTAQVSSPTLDPNAANNSSTATTTVQPSADLAVTVTAPAGVTAGNTLTYTLKVTNNGPSDAQNVALNDLLPTGTAFVSQTQTGGPAFTLSNAANQLNDTIGTLVNGQTATIQVVVQVLPSVASGTNLLDTATVSATTPDPVAGNNSNTATTAVSTSADLATVKFAPAQVSPGAQFTYTFTVFNQGPSDAQNVSVTDALPGAVTYVSQAQANGPVFTLTHVGNSITDTIAVLPGGQSATFQVVVSVAAGAAQGTAIPNTVNVTSTTTDPNPNNNIGPVQSFVGPSPGLAISKVVSNSTPNVGGTITYTTTLTNVGAAIATGITVSDPLPAGLTAIVPNPTAGTTYAGGVWTIPSLAPNATVTLTFTGTVNDPNPHGSTATVTGSSRPFANPDMASATETPQLADLGITNVVSNTTPNQNDTITYTVTLTNTGPDTATNATVGDAVPTWLTGVTTMAASGTSYVGGVWTVPSLVKGGSVTLTFTGQVNDTATHTSTATITAADQFDPTTPDTASATETPTADLTLTNVVNNTAPYTGHTVTYTVTLTNPGPDTATNVTVGDAVPTWLNGVTTTAASGTSYVGGVWTVPSLVKGGSVTLTFTGRVNDTATHTSTATITAADQFDPTTPDIASATETSQTDSIVGNNQTLSTNENTALPGNVTATTNDNDPLTYALATGPTNGLLTWAANGAFTYTPNNNYHGPDSFTFTASDGPNTSAPATVSITVVDNSVPVGIPQSLTTNENTALPVVVAATDSDGDPLTYAVAVGPTHGTLAKTANGAYTYTPTNNYHGPDNFTFTANDGSNTSTPATVSINVVDNSVPVGIPQSLTTNENTALPVVVAATDSDGDPLTYAVAVGPTHGTLAKTANGAYTYTPTNNYHGPDSFTFTANDGTNTSTPATVSINVVDNSVPVGIPQSLTTNENTALPVVVAATDSDGDPLTYAVAVGPTHGTLAKTANGSYTYTPTNNYHGPDSFTFTANDGSNTSTPATVSINVVDNSVPVGIPQSLTTNENTALPVVVAATDSDGDPLTYAVAVGPTHGTLAKTANGAYTYTPNNNYHGPDSFTFTANDGSNTSTPATVSINVVDNSVPVGIPQSLTTNENTALPVVVAATDSDGDPLTYAVAVGPTHGTLAKTANGSYTYTPNNNYHGPDNFTFTANDGSNTSTPATVSINVVDNSVPVGIPQSLTTNENTALPVVVAATDSDGDPLTYAVAVGPTHGTLAKTANGSYTYTPNNNYHGPDSFTFTANDGSNTSTPATVSINVVDNSVPVGIPQSLSTNENTALPVVVAATDSDGDPLTYAVAVGPTHGTLAKTANGSYTYTPNNNYHGPDNFTFTANDGSNTSTPATVSINVVDNSVPVGIPQSLTTNENTPLPVVVAATDSDGDPLTYAVAVGPTHGTLAKTANGAYTYTPNNNYHGPDSFTFTANDGSNTSTPATVSINVVDNSVPVGIPQSLTTNENTALPVVVAATDSDGDPLTYAVAVGPTHGTLAKTANGSYTYTPNNNYHGPDNFTFTANDGTNTSTPAAVSINVVDNSVPVGIPQSLTTNENTALPVVVAATDSDGDSLTYALATNPTHGTLTKTANGSYTYSPSNNYRGPDSFTFTASDETNTSVPATVSINVIDNSVPVGIPQSLTTNENTALPVVVAATDSDGDPLTYAVAGGPTHGTLAKTANGGYTYTPNNNYHGPDSFTFTATDGGNTSVPAAVAINVIDNSVPVGNPQSLTTNENTALPVTLTATDSDGDPLTYAVATGPTHGTLTKTANGGYTYTPSNNYHGPDSFTFTATDGTNTSVPATVSLTVVDNSAPLGNPQTLTTNENTALPVALTATDSDGDPLTYAVAGGPTHGTLTKTANGGYTYTPNNNYHGPDSFTFTAADGTNTSVPVPVSLNVIDNSVPVGNPQSLTTNENTALPVTLRATDSDGDPLTYAVAGGPTHGMLTKTANGGYTYTPNNNYHGPDSFTFTATDGTNTSVPVTVALTVVDNSTPVATGQALTTNQGAALPITLTATDSDGDPLTYLVTGGPTHGTLSGSGASLTYTPAPGYHGPDSFTFTAADGTSRSAPATVAINVLDTSVPATASLSGVVYLDQNNNGVRDPGEPGLPGVTVTLSGTDSSGQPVRQTVVSAADGSYTFTHLPAGTYGLSKVQPSGFSQGKNTTGSAGGALSGTDQILGLVLSPGATGSGYFFGEASRPAATGLAYGDTFTFAAPRVGGASTNPGAPSLSKDMFFSAASAPAAGAQAANRAFVDGLYRGLLGHSADQAGLAYWGQILDSGAARQGVIDGIYFSAEHRSIQVDRFYVAFLHHHADAAGLSFYGNSFLSGAAEADIAAMILGSPEYAGLHNRDTAGFLSGLYADALGRSIDTAGQAYWSRALQNGDRTAVARGFLQSSAALTRVFATDYQNLLGRACSQADQASWNAQLDVGLSSQDATRMVLASDEFFARMAGW